MDVFFYLSSSGERYIECYQIGKVISVYMTSSRFDSAVSVVNNKSCKWN